MKERLKAAKDQEGSVDCHCNEYGNCGGRAIFWITVHSHHRMMVTLEETTDYGEDDDGKAGYDGTAPGIKGRYHGLHLVQLEAVRVIRSDSTVEDLEAGGVVAMDVGCYSLESGGMLRQLLTGLLRVNQWNR